MDEKKKAVRLMQEYIDEHIKETISLKQLDDCSYMSPSYARQLYKEYTGYSPYHYIKSVRLTEAAKLLRDSNAKVIDVALDYVFDSHEC